MKSMNFVQEKNLHISQSLSECFVFFSRRPYGQQDIENALLKKLICLCQ